MRTIGLKKAPAENAGAGAKTTVKADAKTSTNTTAKTTRTKRVKASK